MPDAYPLSWPLGRPRTQRRRRSQFATSPAVARDGLLDELRRLGARQIVVSSNVATYTRGGREVMYADQRHAQEDPGVAVYYTWRGDQYVFSCDRWDQVGDNIQAIRKTIEALRGIERWGTGDAMRAAFTGFKALPAPGQGSGRAWWEALGLAGPDVEAGQMKKAYRLRLRTLHPDNPDTGDRAAFDELQEAWEQAKTARGL